MYKKKTISWARPNIQDERSGLDKNLRNWILWHTPNKMYKSKRDLDNRWNDNNHTGAIMQPKQSANMWWFYLLHEDFCVPMDWLFSHEIVETYDNDLDMGSALLRGDFATEKRQYSKWIWSNFSDRWIRDIPMIWRNTRKCGARIFYSLPNLWIYLWDKSIPSNPRMKPDEFYSCGCLIPVKKEMTLWLC